MSQPSPQPFELAHASCQDLPRSRDAGPPLLQMQLKLDFPLHTPSHMCIDASRESPSLHAGPPVSSTRSPCHYTLTSYTPLPTST